MAAYAPSLLEDRPSPLPIYVALSVAGHILLVALGMIVSWLLAGPKVDLEQKPIKASLVRLGKPRDEKLLPRKEEEAPPPPKVEEAVAVAPLAAQSPVVQLPIKDLKPEKVEKQNGSKDSKKSLFDAFAKGGKQGKAQELEGQVDGDPAGDSAKQEGERYFGLLNSVVRREYNVSDLIDEAERRRLKAEVALRIGPGGDLLEVELTKSSGNPHFDSAVMGAVKKAAPFSPPPEHLRDSLKKAGVAISFTP